MSKSIHQRPWGYEIDDDDFEFTIYCSDGGQEEVMRGEVDDSSDALIIANDICVGHNRDLQAAAARALKPQTLPDQHGELHHLVLDQMERHGGSFVQSLATAWRRADPTNHAKLYSAFHLYYDEYLASTTVPGQDKGAGAGGAT